MAKAKSRRGRPPLDRPKPEYVHIKCSKEWHEWVKAEAEKVGATVSGFAAEAIEYRVFRAGGTTPPKR